MRRVGELIKIIKGQKADAVYETEQPNSYRYLQIDDLRPDAAAKFTSDQKGTLATRNDVLIAWDGANAGTVSFGLDGYPGSTLAILRPNPTDVLTPYLGYFLRSKFQSLQNTRTGATIPHINRESLENLHIPLPSLLEQQRIASILAQADRQRRLRHVALKLGDGYLQSVFLEMFAGPASQDWPQMEINALAKTGKNTIRTGPFGSQLLHSEFVDEGIMVLGIDNAVQNRFALGKPRYITEEKYQQLKRYTVCPGDVIITIMGTTGRCAVIPADIPVAINTKHLCCITLDQSKCAPSYLKECFLTHPAVLRQLGVSERGAVMPGLNMEIIKETTVPLPPLSLQQKFVRVAARHERLQIRQREALRQAEHLFQTLLHQSFTDQHSDISQEDFTYLDLHDETLT